MSIHTSALLVLLALVAPAHADSILLKSSAHLAAATDVVRLVDIAQLEGDEALRLADAEIARVPDSGMVEISIDDVRTSLTAAGARWALIDLSGRSVSVRRADDRPRAMAPMEVPPESEPPAARTAEVRTVPILVEDAQRMTTPRGVIARMLAHAHLGTQRPLRFNVSIDDLAVLDDANPARRHEIVPMTSLTVDRVVVRVATREGDQLISRHDISLRPEFEIVAATAQETIRRNSAFASAPLAVGPTWVPPSDLPSMVDPELLATAVAAQPIDAGSRITTRDVKRTAEIRRNEHVTVRRELELVAIELKAIALEDGAVGDVIRLQIVDRRNRRDSRSFEAVVVGPGQAVVR